jgi:hypothetical protein
MSSAWAHGGGLNAEGCHKNRKTGDYHCHKSAVLVAAQTGPIEKQDRAAAAGHSDHPPESLVRPTCYTGPRGGTYTITRSGRKNYGGC